MTTFITTTTTTTTEPDLLDRFVAFVEEHDCAVTLKCDYTHDGKRRWSLRVDSRFGDSPEWPWVDGDSDLRWLFGWLLDSMADVEVPR